MVDVTEISAIVAAVGVIIGIIFALLQLRNLVKTRQTDLIMRLYSHFGSERFQKIWEDVMSREAESLQDYGEKYGWAKWTAFGLFFEGIGVLLHRKLIDIGSVDDLFTAPITMAWEKMNQNIVEIRKAENQPTIFEWFEYLYNEMQKREQKGAKNG